MLIGALMPVFYRCSQIQRLEAILDEMEGQEKKRKKKEKKKRAALEVGFPTHLSHP